METLVNKIKENIDLFVANAEAQVAKGNKAAGARARKAALDLMKDLKEFRKVSVAETKKSAIFFVIMQRYQNLPHLCCRFRF